ncbi:MAG TPA: hypothetical protein VGH34_03590 [Vicinamibacterales bacterium]
MLTGLFFVACGLLVVAMATGLIPHADAATAPAWVPACAGLTFVAAGLLVIVDFGAARIGPDGQLAPDTPLPIQLASLLLALIIVGLLAVIAGWIAFGPGPRAFTTTLSIPFISERYQSGGTSGRIAFGISTAVLVAVFGASGAVGLRRLWREWQRHNTGS